MSDKPAYMAAQPWTTTLANSAATKWVKSCRMLLAVDEAIRSVTVALEETGRLENTLIAFTSDNGFLFGEHRYFGKKVPYDESVRVPLILRYDAAGGGVSVVDDRLALTIDITATALDAAGVGAPYPLEGRSLLPVLRGTSSPEREAILIEHYDVPGSNGYVPTYCQVRTKTHAYIRYDAASDPVTEELYDLVADPYQLSNLVRTGQPPGPIRDDLLSRMQQMCLPVPPNFDY